MKVRWTILLTTVLLPFVAISFLMFDGVQLIRTRTVPPASFLYWTGSYFLLLILVYIYPRIRHGFNATFYYWKIFIKHIYPLFQIPIRYSIVSLTLSSFIFTGLIIVVTQSTSQAGLIVITAFYASVLFFREIFSSEVPILEMDNLTRMGAGMRETVSFQASIGNVGSETATDPTVKFRVYDLTGRPLTESIDADLPLSNRALDPGEWTEESSVTIYFERADVTDEPPDTVYLHIKTFNGLGYDLLADNKLQKLDISVQTW